MKCVNVVSSLNKLKYILGDRPWCGDFFCEYTFFLFTAEKAGVLNVIGILEEDGHTNRETPWLEQVLVCVPSQKSC